MDDKYKALIGGFAFTLGTGAWAFFLYHSLYTGLPNLDVLRGPLVLELFLHGRPTLAWGRRFMAIFHNEHSDGEVDSDIVNPLSLGDVGLTSGPSAGPGQVLYATAISLGLYSGDAASYSAFGTDPSNLRKLIGMAIEVLKNKISLNNGDFDRATSAYNGDSTGKYLANVQTFENRYYDYQAGSDSDSDSDVAEDES